MRDIIQYARYAGRKIMELVEKDITASKIMTPAAFKNAIIVHSAIGGSTNATIHLPSIARELGYDLPIELFDEINHQVPHLGNINPSGTQLTESFWFAGGIPMVQWMLRDMLDLDVMTVTGKTLGENLEDLHKDNWFDREPGLPGQLRPDPRPGDLPGGEGSREGLRGHPEGQHRSRGLRAEVLRLRHEPAGSGQRQGPGVQPRGGRPRRRGQQRDQSRRSHHHPL